MNILKIFKFIFIGMLYISINSYTYAANSIGKVIIYSGIVAAKSLDGKVRVLSRKSKI